nr:uncharacterized protein LOC109152108 [Ipomoea trifida]
MVDSCPVMEQFHEIIRLLGLIRQHGMNMDDSIAIAGIINKLPPSWKKVHRTLMQKNEELTMEQLGSHLYVEEGIRLKESKNKGVAKATGVSVVPKIMAEGFVIERVALAFSVLDLGWYQRFNSSDEDSDPEESTRVDNVL